MLFANSGGTGIVARTNLLFTLAIVLVVSLFATTIVSAESLKAGEAAPEFKLNSLTGESHALADFRGRVVLLNFWASWCPPCVSEMPALERVYQKYKDKGFSIVSVNVEEEANLGQVKDFVSKHGITFPVLLDPKVSIPQRFGVTGFPESFFISKEGKFLSVTDPLDQKQQVRIISDRPWDSRAFGTLVETLLNHR